MHVRIDPATQDLAFTNGRFEHEDDLLTPLFIRLNSWRGSYIDDPEFGSRLYELLSEKSPATAAKKAPDMVREALQPMLDDGRLSKLEVTAETEIRTSGGLTRRGVGIHVVAYEGDERPYRFTVWQEVGG